MSKEVFNLSGQSNGSYSDATIFGNMAFICGQMSIDPVSGQSVHGDIEKQADLAIRNLLAVTEGLGATVDDVLFVNIYLVEEADFDGFDATYRSYFKGNLPARVTVTVKQLYDNLKIEMTAVVGLPK